MDEGRCGWGIGMDARQLGHQVGLGRGVGKELYPSARIAAIHLLWQATRGRANCYKLKEPCAGDLS
jgi:hypothetical protein